MKNLGELMKVIKETIEPVKCKYCQSRNTVRYGKVKGIQRWWCKDCKRKFSGTDTLPRMKTPVRYIASALSMYYGGMSLNSIRRHLDQQYGYRPSESTLYDWLTRFSKIAIGKAKDYTPKVGDVWVADETVVKVSGQNLWLIDIIDYDTRFLLASRLSPTRRKKDIALLLRKAYLKADKAPKRILTDGWGAYPDAVDLVFGSDTKHIQSTPFVEADSTNIIERFQGTLKDRTKVMRGLKKQETAELLLDGWIVHYNFFRPHESLDGKTPAEKAGIKSPYNNWADILKSQKETTIVPEEAKYPPDKTYRVRAYPVYKKPKHPRKATRKRAMQKAIPTISTLRGRRH